MTDTEIRRLRTELDDATSALSAQRGRSELLAEQRDRLFVELAKERGLRRHYEAAADEADGERAIAVAHAETLAADLRTARAEISRLQDAIERLDEASCGCLGGMAKGLI